MIRATAAVCLSLVIGHTSAGAQDCGGEERWAVKMGADPLASQINLQSQPTSLHDLVLIRRPQVPSDDVTRTAEERVVRTIDAHLVKFKQETGKTGDSDFHLVIADETLEFSKGGAGTTASPHSVIAEIVDPDCVGGRKGSVTTPSAFKSQLEAVRAKFVQQFPDPKSGWNEADGIPVRLTGVTFFDRAHGQVGRALNGLELHPLLDIEFNPGASNVVTPATAATVQPFDNPGFESRAQSWTASAGVITGSSKVPAHSGTMKAWLGGNGTIARDTLSRRLTLPAAAHAIAFTFFLHVESEENGHSAADKLRVRVRDTNGRLLKTLKTYTNQDAEAGFAVQSLNLTQFAGRTVIIEFEAQEDADLSTSFVLDDFALVVEP